MPHSRKRYLRELLLHALRHSPLVGVLGHRQVGKTTLLQQLTENYLSFDDEAVLERVSRNAKDFLSNEAAPSKTSPIALDESQLAPSLFPALKELVRRSPRPGQYLLSGSVRFTSRKAIRESLTGRIINFELHPMSIAELESRPLPDLCRRALQS
ncbi:MAG: AAA family ATPase, partial [Oligoflexia bacterium]|nr:AAA family ATPase [Oligoflexia bacterium]